MDIPNGKEYGLAGEITSTGEQWGLRDFQALLPKMHLSRRQPSRYVQEILVSEEFKQKASAMCF